MHNTTLEKINTQLKKTLNETAHPPSPNSISFLLDSPQKNTTKVCVPK